MNETTFQDPFSYEVWESTYKDHSDNDVNDSVRRVAKAIASCEATPELQAEWEAKFYDMMTGFKGVSGGRIIANAGAEWKGTTLMNCFVGPRGKYDIDSLEGIFGSLLKQAQTLKSEGGWGENFSYCRPRGGFIHGIGVETPGAVKYMELFDKSSDIITSGSGKKSSNKKAKGKIRKGAMMGVMCVWHPDVVEFISAKQQAGRLTKFNMSVNCTDAFMQRLIKIEDLTHKIESAEADPTCGDGLGRGLSEVISSTEIEIAELDKWDLIFPDTTFEKYKAEWDGNIVQWQAKGYPIKVYNTVSASWLWNLIMESTYNRAEPGVLFLDRANYFNPLSYGETIYATNPCVTGDGLVEILVRGTSVPVRLSVKAAVALFKSGTAFKIKSYNIDAHAVEWNDVTFADKTRENADILAVTDSKTGNTIRVTPDHKVAVQEYASMINYVEAKDLKETSSLVGAG